MYNGSYIKVKSYQDLFVFFEKVPKNKCLFVKNAKYEAAGSPEVSSRTLIFSSNKTHTKLVRPNKKICVVQVTS